MLFSDMFVFITTEHTTWEVKKYIPQISSQSDISQSELLYAFDHFPIIALPPAVYEEKRKQAEDIIAHRDPKDVDILALALKFNVPIWTDDNDFKNVREVQILTASKMFEKV